MKARASAASARTPLPRVRGAAQAAAVSRERTLSPKISSASGEGPTKIRPAASQARAKAALSLRNP